MFNEINELKFVKTFLIKNLTKKTLYNKNLKKPNNNDEIFGFGTGLLRKNMQCKENLTQLNNILNYLIKNIDEVEIKFDEVSFTKRIQPEEIGLIIFFYF